MTATDSAKTADEFVGNTDEAKVIGAKRRTMGKFKTPLGPTTYLAPERERLAGLVWRNFDATQLGSTLGAELSGIDLTSDLSDDTIAEIAHALADYKVIFFRNQPLTTDQHVALASRFGELETHPFIPPNADQPELVRFEKSADVAGYENLWHHDVTWREFPSMGAILRAIDVPSFGGDTLFSDMSAAYNGLDDETKERLVGMTAIHDFMGSFGNQFPTERQQEMRDRFPLIEHPVVITHQVTGQKLLYVNRYFTNEIVGLEENESDALLEHLYRQAETVEHQIRFRWENDSVAFWDNRAVQHYASSDYWPQRRVMERASIKGPRPVA
ncbi:TauD Probable taurine catabolism dioxygenase [Acidimicrobiia bacterium]